MSALSWFRGAMQPGEMTCTAYPWLGRLASLRLTLVILALLGMGVLIAYLSETHTTWALVIPLVLVALNLAAAVATNGVFRRKTALLIFHLALIAIILLVAAGRLSYLKGHLELAEGAEFSGELVGQESGPLHWSRLDRVRFVNEGFQIDYAPGVRRGATNNRVRYVDEQGGIRQAVIGDNDALVVHGYRFYTSFNKGFAPSFLWCPTQGSAELGAVHLPAYPAHEYRQAREWTLPGTSRTLWVQLQFDEVILDPDKPSNFRLPARHVLVTRSGDTRTELQPGQTLDLPEGRLEYIGLRSWMGYTVFSDWTTSWLLAASVVAVASLSFHFWRKFAQEPWNPDERHA